MSLPTPEKIRTLQRKLYAKAKAEPAFRFYLLYDKIWRADILAHAYALAKANKGRRGWMASRSRRSRRRGRRGGWPGSPGSEAGVRERTYRPQPVRRVMIPKPGGGERPRPCGAWLRHDAGAGADPGSGPGQAFEADFDPEAYGYRPQRSAQDAVRRVHGHLKAGYVDVVDADLSIPHGELLQCVARRISDKHVLALIKAWLKAPVEERTGTGGKRLTGGKRSKLGTPRRGEARLRHDVPKARFQRDAASSRLCSPTST